MSEGWLRRAKKVIPSASQTYSKSYRYFSEGVAPAFIAHGKGSHVWDVDDNEFVDFVMALGPITLGYNNEAVNQAVLKQLGKGIVFSLPSTLEAELAEKLVEIIPCADMVRFVKNGSDATSAAVRLARAFTGKDMVLACGYHGMHDWYIGSTENNLGVPACIQALIRTFPYNDLESLDRLLEKHKGHVAAVVMEPVRVEAPNSGYLKGVRKLADEHSIVLIFDEVVTGFRLALGGAQEYYGVTPDLSAIGKGMANGMPVSAVVGKGEIMELADRGAFISLTFGGEALSLAASLATIRELQENDVFAHTWRLGKDLRERAKHLVSGHELDEVVTVGGLDIMPGLFFHALGDASENDVMALFQQECFDNGILFLGVNYFCHAHCNSDIEKALAAYDSGLKALRKLKEGVPLEKLLVGKTLRPIFFRNKH